MCITFETPLNQMRILSYTKPRQCKQNYLFIAINIMSRALCCRRRCRLRCRWMRAAHATENCVQSAARIRQLENLFFYIKKSNENNNTTYIYKRAKKKIGITGFKTHDHDSLKIKFIFLNILSHARTGISISMA